VRSHEKLEVEFGRWAGVQGVVACSSGTAALHLALEALRLPQGTEVVVPDVCMVACARACTLAGLTPVFVDVTEDLLLDVDLLDRACSRDGANVGAVMAVHTYGRRCDMEDITDLALKYDFKVVEDLAEAHGLRPHPFTDAACWSFYKNKVVRGEEGGAVAFMDPDRATHARSLRSLGFTRDHDFSHVPRGCNYRLADCLADLILASLDGADHALDERYALGNLYDRYCPTGWRMPPRDVVWVYDLRIPRMNQEEQDTLVQALRLSGIEARHCFKRLSTQQEYRNPGRHYRCRSEGARIESLPREVIYLPVEPGKTTEDEIVRSFEVIARVLD
jgi:perosamine synthetase